MHRITPIVPSSRTPVIAALLVTWVVWGSSFIAIHLTLGTIPPVLMMATRFLAAGAIATTFGLLLLARTGGELPSARAWRDATLMGFGMVTIGMGATGWAAGRLPTGITALLVAAAPLWVALLQPLVVRGAPRSLVAALGIVVGVLGVGALVAPGGSGTGIDPIAALVLVLGNAGWAIATLLAPRAATSGNLLATVGMQMVTGGALLLVVAAGMGDLAGLDPTRIAGSAVGGWTYLVLASSLGGFVAYGWLLTQVSAGVASTHAFVSPLVAVALGALLLHETLDGRVLASAAAVVVAVVLLLTGEARLARSMPTEDALGIDVLDDVLGAAAPPVEGPGTARAAAPGVVRAGTVPARRRTAARPARPAARALELTRARRSVGFAPSPTPSFARRTHRPWQATDGMDALAIDAAFDELG